MLAPYLNKNETEAGCDEAGRGCLAGPVFAAAVILPTVFQHILLDDSKKLSETQRKEARKIIESEAISWAVARIEVEEIDEINILNASIRAMHEAVKKLSVRPSFLLIDGNRFKPFPGINHACIIKGDGKYASIAAASILAKTYRDDYMEKLHEHFPPYLWVSNKGYPTRAHREAIKQFGATKHHRRSFRLLPAEQGKLF